MNNKCYPYRIDVTEDGDSVMAVSFTSNLYEYALACLKKKWDRNAVLEVANKHGTCWCVSWEETWGAGEYERMMEAHYAAADEERRELSHWANC